MPFVKPAGDTLAALLPSWNVTLCNRGYSSAVTIESELCGAVRAAWHLAADDCAPTAESTDWEWTVTVAGAAHLIWIVPVADKASLDASVVAADTLAAAGVGVGRPVRTATGMRTATADITGIGPVELMLRHEPPGRILAADDPLDQQWWGDMLGRAHRELQSLRHPAVVRLRWPVDDDLADVVAAVTRLTVTDQLAYGVLHTNPNPCLFRIDPDTGRSAIARWGLPAIGPLAYDIAIAVHYAGGLAVADDLLDGYASAGPVSRDELDAAVPTMLTLVRAVAARAPASSDGAPASMDSDDVNDDGTGV
jgi:homoserine kinase type II